jgi:hypothetical protein
MFEPLYENIGADVSTVDHHVGDALVIIQRAVQDISVSPYHSGAMLSTTTFNSPTVYNAIGGTGKMNSTIPFLTPIADFLGDLWNLFI